MNRLTHLIIFIHEIKNNLCLDRSFIPVMSKLSFQQPLLQSSVSHILKNYVLDLLKMYMHYFCIILFKWFQLGKILLKINYKTFVKYLSSRNIS